ncbi:D-2-hydroxyacid dehydrogenase [Halalkalicoccus jeotgali]|uniref:Phosphoglycerate dehydrogenase n=1 Tax=Halalkalicoccus jeotgali (strain DSM 18796 / CECT 7217 / JCM 14584 / KCTC 4019 / B3) TaxID=795797 RepID=D8J6Q1_HALJB|nr:D-2-hydroxyacid dehydrogenase [Halalkalicoccus jeotgali]ADJ13928.1 phosphoglycerate dehydrogenase [Halalkalicoccus jeotgali B3]ELY34029.1 phosphoglycerate dehydrogenase [Halalkalicoccus jeotgali B3]
MSETIDVLVLRGGAHGISAEEYRDELRDRLPDHRIALARTPQQERELIQTARVVSTVDIDTDLLSRAENLELFAGVAAGYGHLPFETFEEMDVTVTTASGIHAPNIAEQVLGYLLVMTRRLREGWRREQRHEWRHYQTRELKGSTVTVVGLGSIGQAIVQRLSGFEVETIGMRYTPEKGGPTDEVIGFETDAIHNALARTDHLIVASPLTETTRGLIDADALETLPPDATLTNIGRGPIVETDALINAIQKNQIGDVALDVTDPEPLPPDHVLWQFENVMITPHNAGHSPEHWPRLADIVAHNVRALDNGGDFENVVQS